MALNLSGSKLLSCSLPNKVKGALLSRYSGTQIHGDAGSSAAPLGRQSRRPTLIFVSSWK